MVQFPADEKREDNRCSEVRLEESIGAGRATDREEGDVELRDETDNVEEKA